MDLSSQAGLFRDAQMSWNDQIEASVSPEDRGLCPLGTSQTPKSCFINVTFVLKLTPGNLNILKGGDIWKIFPLKKKNSFGKRLVSENE